jgi:HlyD family secretion protein
MIKKPGLSTHSQETETTYSETSQPSHHSQEAKITQQQKGNKLRNKKWLWIGLALACVIAGAIGFYCFHQSQSSDWHKNTITPEMGSVDLQIIATGTIKPISEIKVSPKSTGQIRKLLVQQGDVVKQNQVLAEMDDSNLRGQINALKGTYMMANDNYQKILHGNRPQEVQIAHLQEERAKNIVREGQHNVIRLKANVESMTQQSIRDNTNADREKYLASQGAISDQDSLNAETAAKMTKAQLEAAKRELAQAEESVAQSKVELQSAGQQHELSKIGNREEDVNAARDAVLQAKGNLETLEAELKDTTIRAPFAGIITQKYADTGAIVTPTTSAATTSATSSSIVALAGTLELVAEVAETDIAKIKIDQPVEIVSNAYPDKPFKGHVTQIAPEAVVTQNVTTFEVHTTIDDDPKHVLLSGMNVSARFVAGKLEDVLLVPTVCVVSRHGKTGVLLAKPDGTPEFKPVKIGPTVGNRTAVIRGLHEDSLVFRGLNKEQLEQQGYGSDAPGGGGFGGGGRGGRGGGGGGGGGGGAPIPRGFGR